MTRRLAAKLPTRPKRRGLQLLGVLLTAGAIAVPVLSAVGPAAAKSKPKPTVKLSQNSDLGTKIVVDGKGRTVYVLDPETKSKLLCTSSDCLAAWPLVTVKSAKTKLVKGKGVSGKLAVLKRGKKYQVTLGGKPLYLFASDSKGDASGEGIKSFGGTWKAIAAGAKTTTPAPSTGGPVY